MPHRSPLGFRACCVVMVVLAGACAGAGGSTDGGLGGGTDTGGGGGTASGGGGAASAGGGSASAGGGTVSTGGGTASAGGGTTSTGGGTASSGGGTAATGGGTASTGGGTSSGLTFTIDVTGGPKRQHNPPAQPTTVSDYVYGINGFGNYVAQKTRFGLIRQGGNIFTAWNWTNDFVNSGSDYCYYEGGDDSVAGHVTSGGDSLPNAQAKSEAYLTTIPIVDHVSAAFSNNTGINNLCPQTASDCNGGMTSSTLVNSGNLSFATVTPASTAFVANSPSKPGSPASWCTGNCTGKGAETTVYQDEYVNFIKSKYGAAGKPPVFFQLDNEPNYWSHTHPEVWPFTGTLPCIDGTTTYDDIVNRNKQYAAAVKNAWPTTKVYGPVVAQDGIIYAHSYSDAHIATAFSAYYLQQMAAASTTAGKPLLDAFDVHYYNSNGDAAQCLQNPRMFWDPGYTDLSASATDDVDFGWAGLNNDFDTKYYPRMMIPRLLTMIATAYPSGGTVAPGLSFSEYNSGCENEIAGGVAEADNLGIFGREGVFSASAWPLGMLTGNYLVAAYDLYRNYDGNGAIVGDLAVSASTSDPKTTSVYAFAHSTMATALDVVAINKASTAQTVSVSMAHAPTLTTVTAYHLVDGTVAVTAVGGTAPTVSCSAGSCTLSVTLPATSATTYVLR